MKQYAEITLYFVGTDLKDALAGAAGATLWEFNRNAAEEFRDEENRQLQAVSTTPVDPNTFKIYRADVIVHEGDLEEEKELGDNET